jgi:hypothetical protein
MWPQMLSMAIEVVDDLVMGLDLLISSDSMSRNGMPIYEEAQEILQLINLGYR